MNSVPGAQLYSMGSKYQDIIFIFSLVETTPKYENYLETAINYTLLQIFRGKNVLPFKTSCRTNNKLMEQITCLQ